MKTGAGALSGFLSIPPTSATILCFLANQQPTEGKLISNVIWAKPTFVKRGNHYSMRLGRGNQFLTDDFRAQSQLFSLQLSSLVAAADCKLFFFACCTFKGTVSLGTGKSLHSWSTLSFPGVGSPTKTQSQQLVWKIARVLLRICMCITSRWRESGFRFSFPFFMKMGRNIVISILTKLHCLYKNLYFSFRPGHKPHTHQRSCCFHEWSIELTMLISIFENKILHLGIVQSANQ